MPSARLIWLLLAAAGGALAASAAHGSQVTRRLVRADKRASEMVRIPAGEFEMGASSAEVERFVLACTEELGADFADACQMMPNHFHFATGDAGRQVFVSSFYMDRFEVSTADYKLCVVRGPCDMRPLVAGDTRYAVDEWPMVNVTWEDADDYCRWVGKRLPTEAEWEKAARGTDGRRWPWGNFDRADGANRGLLEPVADRSPNPGEIGTTVDERDGYRELAPPGSLPFGKSPYGVHDMAGNAAEWVADWYDPSSDPTTADIDPRGADGGQQKITRGGSFFEPGVWSRTYFRSPDLPGERSITRGFRCARDDDAD